MSSELLPLLSGDPDAYVNSVHPSKAKSACQQELALVSRRRGPPAPAMPGPKTDIALRAEQTKGQLWQGCGQ